MADHHRILKCLRDNGPSTEEQILDCKRLITQSDAFPRVEKSLPKMVVDGLITEKDGVYTITEKGLAYLGT